MASEASRDRFPVIARRGVRYWTDGLVIGSELFVREVTVTPTDVRRALHNHLVKGTPAHSPDGPAPLPLSPLRFHALTNENHRL